jgi:hypothetical protein
MLRVKAHNARVRSLKQIHRKKPRTHNRGIRLPLNFDLDALPNNTRLSRHETAAGRWLKPWGRPFPDLTRRLAQHRRVAAERPEGKAALSTVASNPSTGGRSRRRATLPIA